MKKYEYKSLEMQVKEGFFSGTKKYDLPEFLSIVNKEGQEGWLVVQVLPSGLVPGVMTGKNDHLLVLFQREIAE